MATNELRSLEIETQLLATLIRWPEEYHSISPYIAARDFTSKLNKGVFYALQKLSDQDSIDTVILVDTINGAGLDFGTELDGISLQDYIEGLALRQTKKENIKELARQLAIKTFTREKYKSIVILGNELKSGKYGSIDDIISVCDQHLFSNRDWFDGKIREPENIFESLESVVEELGNNPVDAVGLLSPSHPKLNDLWGSLFRPGNISVITARSKAGKTLWKMDLCIKVADHYDIPVLHLDNAEMTLRELQMRAAASLSGVPIHLIETGKFRRNEDMTKKIRAVWPRVKKMKYFYYNIGGRSTEQMLSVIQRFYYTKVGRDTLNKMICCFDYIKSGMEVGDKRDDLLLGNFMTKLKTFVSTICPIGMLTSVQSNRFGITTNKKSSEINDSESIVGGSDQITWQASHNFILRKKTLDELAEEGGQLKFGTHKLINLVPRHMGEKVGEAIAMIKWHDGSYKNNWINYHVDNFRVEERGTGQDVDKYCRAKLDSSGKGIVVDI